MALSPDPHSAQHSGCSCPLMGVKEDSPREQMQGNSIITRTQRQGEMPSLQKTGMISGGRGCVTGETDPRSHSYRSHLKICLTSQPTQHITDEHCCRRPGGKQELRGASCRKGVLSQQAVPSESSSISMDIMVSAPTQAGCCGLNIKCHLWVHVFEHLSPRWLHCFWEAVGNFRQNITGGSRIGP